MKELSISRSDSLAIERTKLANERTFLAYFRTFVVFVSSGFAVLKIAALKDIHDVGMFLLILGPVLFLIGMGRFFYVKWKLKKFYHIEYPASGKEAKAS